MAEQPPDRSRWAVVAQSKVGGRNALDDVFDAAGTGIVVVDSESTVQHVDARIERFFGVSAADVVGVDSATLFESHIAPTLARPDRIAERDGSAGPGEHGTGRYHVTDGDGGAERWVSHHSHSIDDGPLAGGHVEQFVDVTDEATVARLERYERIVENTDDGVFIVDDDRRLEYANRSALEAAGASPAEIEGRSVLEITRAMTSGDDAVARVESALEAVLTDSTSTAPVEIELRVDLSSGPATLRYRFTPLSTDDGRKAVVTVRDVSEYKERQRRFETLADNFPNGAVTLVDTDLRYQLARGQLSDRLSWEPADFEGSKVRDAGLGEREKITEVYRDALAGDTVTVETSVEDRVLTLRARPVYDDDGTVRAAIGMTQDVTERTERERELRRKRDFLQYIQEVASIGGWEVDRRSDTLHWTDEVYRLHDVPMDYEPTEEDGIEFYHPDDRGTITDAYEALVEDGESYDLELRIVTAADEVRWVRTIGRPWYDESGAIVGARGTFQDITERKERERELVETYDLIADMEELADIGAWEYDPETEATMVTDGMARIHGIEPDKDLTLEEAFDKFHPDDRDRLIDRFDRCLENGESYEIDVRLITAEGAQRWVTARGERINKTGGSHVVRGYLRNITERKERERELHRKSRAIDEAPVGISITDPSSDDNPMIAVNDKFLEITGYEREAVLGRNCRFLQGDGTDEASVATIRREIDAERPVSVELRNYRADGTEFWNHLEIAPVHDEDGTLVNYVGFQRDVTDRKRHERELEKRQRVLDELHEATRAFHPPASEDDVAEFVVSFIERAFDFEYVSVKRFDDAQGALEPVARSGGVEPTTDVFGTIAPGPHPIWESFRATETRVLDHEAIAKLPAEPNCDCDQLVVVPIGDFGVTVVCSGEQQVVDDVDLDLMEVVAANAQSDFKRLRSERNQSDLAAELSNQRDLAADLQSVIDAVRAIQQRVAASESRDALETGVCEELLGTDRVDYAWIGRPRGSDTDLSPTAWAGDDKQFFGRDADGDYWPVAPAQRAAANREQHAVPSIPSRVGDEQWAKDALSAGFKSTTSVPLVYDDVLYGVLTAYSATEDAFGPIYESLLEDVGTLVVNYSRIIEDRYTDVAREQTELEFELIDDRYPLHRLATAAGATIRYLTVAERTPDSVRCLVAVEDASVEHVLDEAAKLADILEIEPFGDTDNGQLSVTVPAPFLSTVVAKHGGTLVGTVSDGQRTQILVEAPTTDARRHLLDALTSRYDDVELVAQRQVTSTNEKRPVPEDVLTDRQYEILNAAYHGGYYESPRGVTGQDLAESFDISSPAIYNHLQAAHRSLLAPLLESDGNFHP